VTRALSGVPVKSLAVLSSFFMDWDELGPRLRFFHALVTSTGGSRAGSGTDLTAVMIGNAHVLPSGPALCSSHEGPPRRCGRLTVVTAACVAPTAPFTHLSPPPPRPPPITTEIV
jgi:hypothetical protein